MLKTVIVKSLITQNAYQTTLARGLQRVAEILRSVKLVDEDNILYPQNPAYLIFKKSPVVKFLRKIAYPLDIYRFLSK